MNASELAAIVHDARARTLALVADLSDDQLMAPPLPTVNPLLWEIGHVAWFQERWALRHVHQQPPFRPNVDDLYDSSQVPHNIRWDLPLLSRDETQAYLCDTRDRVLDLLATKPPTPEAVYFNRLAVFHEDMHDENFTITRQTYGWARPRLAADDPAAGGPLPGDVTIPGGTLMLGATPDEPFVFDNEKWAHPVDIEPFRMARAPVTQSDFAGFVEEGGYARRALWSDAGWRWREQAGTEMPVYWRRSAGGFERRDFAEWVPLEPHRPVIHVNWYEADAYCRWAERRLPTEAEWEMAAALDPSTGRKRRFPWGDDPPTPERTNLDWRAPGTVDVGAHPAGDSAFGCRQMIGNVWEWTADDFGPYPGFVADPYEQYSEPWFSTHKALRGGCWATTSRLLRNTWRNFYRPERRDVLAGFRTCAL